MAKVSETQHPMRLICQAWLEKIKLALEVRQEKFGKFAVEADKFYDGAHNFMWEEGYSQGQGGFLKKNDGAVLPTFRVTINNVFKAVALFGPVLYHQNPNILVAPTLPPQIPPEALGVDMSNPYLAQEFMLLAQQEQMGYVEKQACGSVQSTYLNWIQRETDKKTQARRVIQEAIVTGLGYLETSIFQPPASRLLLPRSTYVSWTDVVIDPDAAYWEDVEWIALRRTKAVNKTERRFGLEPDSLEGHLQSYATMETRRGRREAKENRKGQSFDLIEYWEVFSKNGFGDRLFDDGLIPKAHQFDYSELGDYCWLAVAHDIPYPLNCPTEKLAEGMEAVYNAVQWPTPYWFDQEGWPISRLHFYEKSGSIWPIGIFKPAIGEMRFVNWCMSFLADKTAASCTTYVAYLKAAGASIQKQLNGQSTPFTILEIQEALGFKRVEEAVSFLQSPEFPQHIWVMLREVTQEIDEKTGVTELLQGMTNRSMRSAAEANIKNERVSVRPDDMAARTEDFLSEVAVREMQAARWHCEPEHVAPAVGQLGAILWQNYVMTKDPDELVRGFDYTVEAGSTRKPNKQQKIQQLTEFGQHVLPILQQLVLQGIVDPFNAYLVEWCKLADIDPQPFLVQLPQPQGPSPEEQQMQAEMAIKVQELELSIAEMQAKLAMEQQALDAELKHEEDMAKLELESKQQDMALKKQESKAKVQATKAQAKAKPKPKSKSQ